jgi:hypothetical protein
MEDDQHVFDGDHHGERPYDNRQDPDEVIVEGWLGKCRRVHIEWAGPDVAVDDAD